MIRPDRRWNCFVAALWFAIGAAGIDSAMADEVQVNTYTSSAQRVSSVAVAADGDFVVVWQSAGSDGTDSSYISVQGQRYASDGSAVGGQFQINTYTPSNQSYPSVSAAANGDFVVVWESFGSGGMDTSGSSIQGQRFASDGAAVGEEFEVNTYTLNSQLRPSVSMDADGDFVVVWGSYGSFGTDSLARSIQGQRYASDGSPIGGQFQVNTYVTSAQRKASVSMDADGDFAVVWESYGSAGTDSSFRSIQGQRYASDGSKAGNEFQVNSYTTGLQKLPSVSLHADGDFVVVWANNAQGDVGAAYNIQGQRYASDGSSVGGQFQANTLDTEGVEPIQGLAVSVDADGDFVVVWESSVSVGTDSSYGIQGRHFAADGSTVGGQFQINTYTTSFQLIPSVAVGAEGTFVVVWESFGSAGTDTSSSSVQMTRLLLFADGFESGDTSAW